MAHKEVYFQAEGLTVACLGDSFVSLYCLHINRTIGHCEAFQLFLFPFANFVLFCSVLLSYTVSHLGQMSVMKTTLNTIFKTIENYVTIKQ